MEVVRYFAVRYSNEMNRDIVAVEESEEIREQRCEHTAALFKI
jgi:hypothetical protein